MYHVVGLKQTRGIENVTLEAAKKKKNRGYRGLLGRVIKMTGTRGLMNVHNCSPNE